MSNDLQVITDDIYSCRPDFMEVLIEPSINFEREAKFAIQVLEGNSYALKVAMQNRRAVIDAVTNIASIGLSLNPAKKQAYFVPRKGKICLDISYMGLMDLAMATGSVRWGQAKLVYENDVFELNGVDKAPTHKSNPFATDRGIVIGVYVVIKTADGDFLTHTMSIAEVYAIRDRSEAWKAYVRDNSKICPWVTDHGEMVKKTCVKQAYKYWPKTDRLEKAIHHLNTDTDESIVYSTSQNSAPATDPDLAALWIGKVGETRTEEELKALWQDGLAVMRAAKDMPAYEALKAAVIKRGEELKSAAKPTHEAEYVEFEEVQP